MRITPSYDRLPVDRKLLTRIFSKITISEQHSYNDTPCWEWTASISSTGYGQSNWHSFHMPAHKLMYLLFVDGIPAGMHCDHLCRIRHCVNPIHIEVVSPKTNILRGEGPAAKNAAKTHCLNGHPFSDTNLYISTTGKRSCIICRNEHARNKRVPKYHRRRTFSDSEIAEIKDLHFHQNRSLKYLRIKYQVTANRLAQMLGDIRIQTPNKIKTHCSQGHEYTPENTYLFHNKEGIRRRCRTCNRDRAAAQRNC